jgi:hypothetical protein
VNYHLPGSQKITDSVTPTLDAASIFRVGIGNAPDEATAMIVICFAISMLTVLLQQLGPQWESKKVTVDEWRLPCKARSQLSNRGSPHGSSSSLLVLPLLSLMMQRSCFPITSTEVFSL